MTRRLAIVSHKYITIGSIRRDVPRTRGARNATLQVKIDAVRRIRAGMTQTAVASAIGVDPSTVSRWWRQSRRGGAYALMNRPVPGRPRKLPELEVRQLAGDLRMGPAAHGFRERRWTLVLVADLIRRTQGVSYHPSHVWKFLRANGISYD